MPRRRTRTSSDPPPRLVRKLNTVGSYRRIVKTVGSVVMLKAMSERLGIRAIVDSLIPMQRDVGLTHGQIVETLVVNRCHAPAPLYEITNWANLSGMADLYGCRSEAFNDDRIRATLDVLSEYEADLQSALVLRIVNEFQVPIDEVLYDLTSLYFEGDYDQSELVALGYSRDQKPDKKQVNLALTTSKQGAVPLQAQTLKGNTGDPSTVEANAKALKNTLRRQKFLQITDGGMLTPENVHRLEQEGIEFLAPWQADTALLDLLQAYPVTWEEMEYRGPKGNDRYWTTELGISVVYEEVLEDQPQPPRQPGQRGRLPKHPVIRHTYWERAIITRSSKKQELDAKTRAKHMKKIEEQLQKIQGGLNKRRLKTRVQVETKLNALLSGNYAVYRQCLDLALVGVDQEMSFTWSWNASALERLQGRDGIYVLLTNRKDPEKYPAAWALNEYKARNPIEARIRDLKSSVKIRPLFVHTDARIQALVFITVVALQVYSLIEWEAEKVQQDWTTNLLKRAFSGICILQTLNEDHSIDMEWCNLSPDHVKILDMLGLSLISLPDRLEPFT